MSGHANCLGCGRVLMERGEKTDGLCTESCFKAAAAWVKSITDFDWTMLPSALVRRWLDAGKPTGGKP